MDSVRILKTAMSVTNIDDVAEDLIFKNRISVAICNANTLVRCYKDKELNNTINSFDIRCPDGFPVAKASKILYQNNQMPKELLNHTRTRYHLGFFLFLVQYS